jgi:hypothetical protein
MAYERRTSLGGGGNEPLVGFLTGKNLGGMFVCGLLVWCICRLLRLGADKPFGPDWWLMLLLVGIGGVAGIVLTMNFTGISWLDRVLLALGYLTRKPTGGTIVTPTATAPVVRDAQRSVTLIRDGEVIARPYRREEALDG